MIPDELVARTAPGRSRPTAGHPRHRAEPGRLLPGARGVQPLLPRLPRRRAGGDGRVRGHHRPPVPAVRVPGHPEAERVVVMMGSGARRRPRGGGRARRAAARRSASLKVRLFRPFPVEEFMARAAAHRPSHRRPRSHQGAGRHRRAALPGRRDGAARGRAGHFALPLHEPQVIGGRYGLSSKEFTPAMVKAVYDELSKASARSASSRSASTTT